MHKWKFAPLTSEAMKQIRGFYDEFYTTHPRGWNYRPRFVTNTLRSFLSLRDGGPKKLTSGRALDLGCGLGEFTETLAQVGFDEVVGIDSSEVAISRANEISNKGRNIHYYLGDFFNFQSPVLFDYILCKAFSPSNTGDLSKINCLLAKVSEILKEHGWVTLSVPTDLTAGGATWRSWNVQEIEDVCRLAKRYFGTVKCHFMIRPSWTIIPAIKMNRISSVSMRVLCGLLRKRVWLVISLSK